MGNQISPVTEMMKQALSPKDVVKTDREAFLRFYTGGFPDKIFVPVADFLAWKGVHVKSEDFPSALHARQWTFAFRDLAAGPYKDGDEMFIKRATNESLLIDLDFLIEAFDDAKAVMMKKAFGC